MVGESCIVVLVVVVVPLIETAKRSPVDGTGRRFD